MSTLFARRSSFWLAWGAGLLLALLLSLGGAYMLRDRIPLHWRLGVRAAMEGIRIDHDLRIRMPDGIELAASLYLPEQERPPYPTVLVRLPYGRLSYGEGMNAGLFFARQGYAVVVQDLRGKFDSQGEFVPWRGATEDGVSTLDWIAVQPWSNGKVGTIGCSALGEVQYSLAKARHPAHAAMIPSDAGGAYGLDPHFGFYEGGVLQLASALGWFLEWGFPDPATVPPGPIDVPQAVRRLPVRDLVRHHAPDRPNSYTDFLGGIPLEDARWRSHGFAFDEDRFDTPSLAITTWGDQSLDGALALAARSVTDGPRRPAPSHHLILAPGNHCQHEETAQAGRFGDLQLGPQATLPYRDWYVRWFDHWLKGQGEGLAALPRYLFYVLGEDRWMSAGTWPPEGVRSQRWHLDSGGRANGRQGDGRLRVPSGTVAQDGHDEFIDDPLNPVPSRGGPLCCTGDPAQRAGPVDQADVESREDVLVYTSAPLERPLRLAGPLKARLTVSSSEVDTDLVARLVHVWPDGRATNIQEGALRLQYREGFRRPQLMQPGQRYEVEVKMRSIAYLLPAGHRLRLHVAGTSFPRLERNLHTGGDVHAQTRAVVARTRVHHGAGSYLELPVLEQGVVWSAGQAP